MKTITGILCALILVVLVCSIVGVLLAYPLMLAINYLIAPHALFAAFGVTQLGFFQTWVLLFICGSLFKSTTGSSKE